jgi:hypothetical protein
MKRRRRRQTQRVRLDVGLRFSVDSSGRTIWIADAHRDDGKRFVVPSEEKLTAFLDLERVARDESN